jgi:hypothetical protein
MQSPRTYGRGALGSGGVRHESLSMPVWMEDDVGQLPLVTLTGPGGEWLGGSIRAPVLQVNNDVRTRRHEDMATRGSARRRSSASSPNSIRISLA